MASIVKEYCLIHAIYESKLCDGHNYDHEYDKDFLKSIQMCFDCEVVKCTENPYDIKNCFLCKQELKIDRNKSRNQKNKDAPRCLKDGCKFKKSDENNYCGKHQADFFLEETNKKGLKTCKNYIRGCRIELNNEYKFSKCEECLKNDREKDKNRRNKSAEENKDRNDGMIICTVCCKSQPEDLYIGIHGNTKTCKSCRDSFKRADEKRDKEHINELARVNSQKPERKEVKKEWRENNADKVLEYSRAYRRRKMEEDIQGYLDHNAERMKKWRENHPEWVGEFNKERRENIKYKFSTYVRSAKQRNIEFNLSEEEFTNIIKMNCNYCGEIDTIGFNGVDRIDSDKSYNTENCVSCCKMCNYMKCALDKELFIYICEHISTYNKLCEDGKLHPEVFHNYKTSYTICKRSASDRSIPFDITKDDYGFTTTNNCYVCGKNNSPEHNNGLDRYNSKIGYTKDNIRSCCATCNYMKKDYDYQEFIEKCKKIYLYTKGSISDDLSLMSKHFMGK